MAARRVQISLEEELLRRIDADPETRQLGRSAFVRSAVELYLEAKQRHAVDQAILRAYDGSARELVEDIADLMKAQSWPP